MTTTSVELPYVNATFTNEDIERAKHAGLTLLASGGMTIDEYRKLDSDASAILAARASKSTGKITVKANPDKRSISLYGINSRMPVTLYREQWERLFADGKTAVEGFINEFGEYLPSKTGAKKPVPATLIGDGKPFRNVEAREPAAI